MNAVVNFNNKDFDYLYNDIKNQMMEMDNLGIYSLDFELNSFVNQMRDILIDNGYHVRCKRNRRGSSFTVCWGHMHSYSPKIVKCLTEENAKIQAHLDVADYVYSLIDKKIDLKGKIKHDSRQAYVAELVRILSKLDIL